MIKVKNVSKYYGSFRALDDISFNIQKGEVVGFLGPNGAGKTTTIKLLTCNTYPHNGQITIAGYDVIENSLKVKRHIGYLPESAPLYKDLLVREYLAYAASSRGIRPDQINNRIVQVATSCGLTQHLNKKISQLSKGYRQRVGLAQAIIHEPDVLILDEPYTGLDPIQIIEIRKLIQEYGKEHTVLLSSHILQEVEATCSRVLIINEGKIVADGKVKELLGHNILQARIEGEDPAIINKFKNINTLEIKGSSTWEENGKSGVDLRVKSLSDEDMASQIFDICKTENWRILNLGKGNLTFEDLFIQYVKNTTSKLNSSSKNNKSNFKTKTNQNKTQDKNNNTSDNKDINKKDDAKEVTSKNDNKSDNIKKDENKKDDAKEEISKNNNKSDNIN